MARHRSSGGRGGIGIGIGSIGMLLTPCLLLLLLLPASSLAKTMHELVSTYAGGWIQDGVMFDVRTVAVDGDAAGNGGGGGGAGAGPGGVTVFGMNILTPLTSEFCVELYTRAGGFAPASSNPNAWTFLGSFTLIGQGPNQPTPIPVGAFDPVVMRTGQTTAFYVTTQNEKLRYTALDDGTVTGDVFATSEVYTAEEDVRGRKGNKEGTKGRGKGGRGKGRDRDRNEERRALEVYGGDSEGYAPYGEYMTPRSHEDGRTLQNGGANGGGVKVEILAGVAKNYPFDVSWPHRVFNGALLYTLGRDTSTGILTPAEIATAQASRRGLVTCDAAAIPPTPPPTTSPTPIPTPKSPTTSPVGSPTVRPSDGPTDVPTLRPTTLESTIRKVATTLHGGLKQSGCMFDIRVPSLEQGGPPEGITVIAVETSTFLVEEICVEVYSKAGTYVGFEEDVVQEADGSWSSPNWSILGAATVMGRGEREPTHLPIGALDPVHVKPGETRAFYVTMTVPEMRYTEPKYDEESGDLFSGSPLGHMELMVGSAVAYPFEESWPDRIFNGAIVYALGDVGDSKYNEMGPDDRERSCPRLTDAPTKQPTKVPTKEPTKGPTETPSKTPTKVPTEAPTPSPIKPVPAKEQPVITPAPAKAEVPSKAQPVVTPAPVKAEVPDDTPSPVAEPLPAPAPPVDEPAPPSPPAGPETGGDVVDKVDALPPPSPKPTPFPTFDIVTLMPTDPPVNDGSSARLSGSCPSAGSADSPAKDVEVEYEYAAIVDADADAGTIATEMEDELHRALMADMCSDGRRLASGRALQTATYRGFNSNPDDRVSEDGCEDGTSVPQGQECILVVGGITATVDEDADERKVWRDVTLFAEGVFSDPATYQGLGVQTVGFGGEIADDSKGGTDQGENVEGTDPSVIGGANKGGDEDTAPDDGSADKGLSTTGKIIIGVLASTLILVIVGLVAMHLVKKRRRRRSDSKELFREFPDEEEHVYGGVSNPPGATQSASRSYDDGGYDNSGSYDEGYIKAPLYTSSSSAPPPPASPPPGAGSGSSRSSPAVILNEMDEVSLVSNDRSKSKFAASVIAGRTASGSVGSGGSSRGSKSSGRRSVEFVRAGQSFSSRQSNQPEDTVDL